MNINQLIQSLHAAKALMREHGEKALKTAFQEFFNECPEIVDICWTQYTPYFNDGEACTFSVNTPAFHTQAELDECEASGESEFWEDSCYVGNLYWVEKGNTWSKPPTQGRPLTSDELRIRAAAENLEKVFGLEDLMEMTFGDHVCVRATRDGFEVDGYEHD